MRVLARVIVSATIATLVLTVGVAPARAQAPAPPAAQTADGEAIYKSACASCHGAPTAESKIPTRDALRAFTPEAIFNALANGKMQIQGLPLSTAEKTAVSEFLAGREMSKTVTIANKCTATSNLRDLNNGPNWNGWGNGLANTRYQPADRGKLTAADIPKLKLKWAFGYANISAARAQPSYAGGRLFVASENGEVHSLDPKTGCTYWTFKAQAGVRTPVVAGPYRTRDGRTGSAVYFGDATANAYAVDAATGQQIWVREVDTHKFAAITGGLAFHNGRVYVPVQGLNEEGQGGRGGYACCTFRGSLVALDANTGNLVWQRFTIEEPKPRAKNKDGVQMFGPAGAGIWSSPTIDAKRNMVYVATGNNYADPSQPTSDAVIAMDLNSGAIKWVRQATPNDNWTIGCRPENPDNPACPQKMGPDFDFSASPAMATANGKDLLVLPQKSGMAYALDPDNEGAIVWQQRIGQGSGLGGQWGGAIDPEAGVFYTGAADFTTPNPGGMRALRLATGEMIWSIPPQAKLCTEPVRGCSAAQGAAVTAIPGAVFSGSADGGLRAYAAKDGAIIWTFDTNRDFETVNGVKAKGAGLDGPGPIIVDGMMYVNSGYGGIVGRPGNVLLAFGLE